MRSLKIEFTLLFYFCVVFGIAQTTKTDSLDFEEKNQTQELHEKIDPKTAPVMLAGDTLFLLHHSVNEYPVIYRANQISQRLESLSKDYKKGVDTIYGKQESRFASVMYNDELAFVITENDAANQDLSLEVLTDFQIKQLKEALKEDEKYHLTTQGMAD